jgi:hypothetical protein
MKSKIAKLHCLSVVALFAAACGGETLGSEGEAEGEVAVVEEAHVGHNNPFIGNDVDKPSYRIEYMGADGYKWTKYNVIDTTADGWGQSAWNYSRNSNRVCHRRGGVYDSTGGCMSINCGGCKSAFRPDLDATRVDELQGTEYWRDLNDGAIAAALEWNTRITNHFSHPDTLGYDADDAFMVRFDLKQGIRGYESWTAVVELDVAIPNEAACEAQGPAAVTYVQMEASYYACDSASSRTNCVVGYMGNGANDVYRHWNGSTCEVSTYHRVFRRYIGNRYIWNIQVAAVGGVGHLPAPVRVRLE